ncbi:hypothetical protein JW992_10835 [candidate division KSB1 bacterium]|nr:hypothetical protein [candidate division KSB1 bacterium]
MRQSLQALIELAKIDEELLALEQAKGDLPSKVNQLKTGLQREQEKIDSLQVERQVDEDKKRLQDGELVDLRERLKKYQSQLYQVKTNKEYDAITLEIEETEKMIEAFDFNNLELEERIGELTAQIGELEGKLQDRREELAAHEKQLLEVTARTHAQEAVLQEQRKAAFSVLSAQVYNMYERIRRGRSGNAVAYLVSGACSACSSRIPPQRGLEIRMMNRLFVCEVCGRILVWTPEIEPSNQEENKP